MSVGGEMAAEYERVYSAASWMMWLEYPWRGQQGWSEEREAAWQALEEVLAADAGVPAGPGEPSDPTRHLLTRRGPGDQPVPLAEAAQDWWTRLKEGRQTRHPGYALLDHPEMYGDIAFEPGANVMVTSRWVTTSAEVTADLKRRLAPGRPGCVIAEESEGLSVALHEIADHLRNALTGQGTTPRPGRAPWITGVPTSFSSRVDAVRLEQLRRVAQIAADQIPSREQLIATRDRSVKKDTARAAETLRQVLAGEETSPWRERGSMDARHDLMSGGTDASFARKNEKFRRRVFEESPMARLPQQRELAEPYRDGEPRWKALTPETTLVVAEILDESAARLTPGRATSMIGYDAQPFSHLSGEITTFLFNL